MVAKDFTIFLLHNSFCSRGCHCWAYRNSSGGGLMCSFTDKELSEFIQAKKRIHGTLEIKHAVAYVGKQANGYWVLNSELTVNEDGDRVSCEDSPYIWLGCMHDGRAIAKATDAVTVSLPLSTENIAPLLSQLRDILHHNFYPGVFITKTFCTSSSTVQSRLHLDHQERGKLQLFNVGVPKPLVLQRYKREVPRTMLPVEYPTWH